MRGSLLQCSYVFFGSGCAKSRRRGKLIEQISLRIASTAMTISERVKLD